MFNLRIRQRIYLLPIITPIFCILSFLVTYIIAASLGHVELVFPYISYTGLKSPERGVFGQLINMASVLLGLNAYFRFLRLQMISSVSKKLNQAFLILGLLSAFGISLVANFETVEMRGPHYVGAFLGFGLAWACCLLNTIMSWKRRNDTVYRPRLSLLYQIVVFIILSVLTLIFVITKIIYKSYKRDDLKLVWGKVRFAYLASTTTEWLMACSLMAYLLSFVPDFRGIAISGPEIVTLDSLHNKDQLDGITITDISKDKDNGHFVADGTSNTQQATDRLLSKDEETGLTPIG